MFNELPDQQLAERFARSNDLRAFEELVRRWDARVLGYLAKATGDYEAAKDLRQEVFLRIYKYGRTYRAKYAFTTWLFRIVSNVLATWRRREHRRPIAGADDEGIARVPDQSAGPHERAAFLEARNATEAAIAQLDAAERELILLRFDLGLTYREISEVLKEPETTLKSRLYASLTKLRRLLADSIADTQVLRSDTTKLTMTPNCLEADR